MTRKEGRKTLLVAIMLIAFLTPANICQAQDVGSLIAPLVKGAVGLLVDKAFEPSTEKYQVGKYEIRVYEGESQNKPCIYLDAYDKGEKTGWLTYSRDDKEIAAFKKMTEPERKVYLKETFKRFNVFLDFGPDEPVKAAEAPAPAKETASATTPQTTETAPAPEN